MNPEEKKTALGATNTESGKANESEHSLPANAEKVKSAHPLDLRTEMFMLNELTAALSSQFVSDDRKWHIISGLISKCAEANGI